MEVKFTNNNILTLLEIISWIIFVGLCVNAGVIIVNTVITLFINPNGVHNFWTGTTYLSALFSFDKSHFIAITFLMIIVATLKAIMFYRIILVFSNKQLNLVKPFSEEIKQFILHFSYLAFSIGLFSRSEQKYVQWLSQHGVVEPNL